MIALRYGTIILVALLVVLALANVIVYVKAPGDGTPALSRYANSWQRWLAATPAERSAYVRQYEALVQRPDATVVIRRARQFARLTPAEQGRLRGLLIVLQETLDSQPAGRRRELLRSSARARAFLVYQVLEAESPEKVAELRTRWSEQP